MSTILQWGGVTLATRTTTHHAGNNVRNILLSKVKSQLPQMRLKSNSLVPPSPPAFTRFECGKTGEPKGFTCLSNYKRMTKFWFLTRPRPLFLYFFFFFIWFEIMFRNSFLTLFHTTSGGCNLLSFSRHFLINFKRSFLLEKFCY